MKGHTGSDWGVSSELDRDGCLVFLASIPFTRFAGGSFMLMHFRFMDVDLMNLMSIVRLAAGVNRPLRIVGRLGAIVADPCWLSLVPVIVGGVF